MDFSKLQYAVNLTQMERDLIGDLNFIGKNFPGTQQVRSMIGHHLFGSGVVHGTPLFWTISPNASQFGLCIRLSRFLTTDPYVNETNSKGFQFRDWIGDLFSFNGGLHMRMLF